MTSALANTSPVLFPPSHSPDCWSSTIPAQGNCPRFYRRLGASSVLDGSRGALYSETTMQPTFRAQLFINGGYVPAASGKTFSVLNPDNNEALTEIAEAGVEDVDR